MNISELIKELQEIQKIHGDDLPVHVWADHGQMCMQSGGLTLQWVDEDGDCYAEEDAAEYDDLIRVLEISG